MKLHEQARKNDLRERQLRREIEAQPSYERSNYQNTGSMAECVKCDVIGMAYFMAQNNGLCRNCVREAHPQTLTTEER